MRKLVVLAMLLAAPGAQASHMGMYSYTPVEHDDQGRSVEPDFASTAVLGPLVANRVVDADLDGVAVPDSALPQPFPGISDVLAPGCWDDAGRQPSGLCGLHTTGFSNPAGTVVPIVPSGLLGVEGMSGVLAPGAFTPAKATRLRFLDARVETHAGPLGTYLELNRKLDDASARAGLPGLADAVVGPSAVWAWYGQWQDKNGNGVIDSLYNDPANQGPVQPDDEFVWYGNCMRFPQWPNPQSVASGFCAYDAEAAAGRVTTMWGFLFPGNHHGTCGGYTMNVFGCPYPADFPGRQAVHFLGEQNDLVCILGFSSCYDPGQDLDDEGEQWFGDPLLDPQDSVLPDQAYDDRSGDPSIGQRHWVYGWGNPTWFYDQSVAVRLVHVTVVGCAPGTANLVELSTCRFADVDVYESLNPQLEELLESAVKPALRGPWVFVRDRWVPLQGEVGDAAHHPLVRSGIAGALDDAFWNPGWSREPNDAGDAFPAAVRGTGSDPQAQHHGWYNDYRDHQLAPHAFGDLQVARVLAVFRPIGVGNCLLCVSGVALATDYAGEAPHSLAPVRASGDHRMTMGPGLYLFSGIFGLWHDKPQAWEEQVLDPLTLTWTSRAYTAPPDGWVGNIVNATGAFRDRGYPEEECTTDQGHGVWPFAWCHPYMDGALQDPQQLAYGEPPHGELRGRCDAANDVLLTPADGRWDVPVFVWRSHGLIDLGKPQETLARVEDHTGSSEPIALPAPCHGPAAGRLEARDLLVLPLGNLGETFEARVTVQVGPETVTDADTYHGWGA